MNVYIREGRIASIDSGAVDQKDNVIKATGKYLIPGWFDCHVHTTDYQIDFPKLIHYGVTSVFITGGSRCTDEYYEAMRTRGNQDSLPAPRVFHTSQHFTMEGRHPVKTYASSHWREGETVFFIRDTAQIAKLVKQVSETPILGIKLTIEDGPAPPFVERIPQAFIDKVVSEAAKYGLEVYAHASDNEEFLMAVNGGVRNLVHFVGIDIDWDNQDHVAAVEKLKERNASIVTTLMIDKSFIYPLHPEWFEVPDLNEAYPYEALIKLRTPQAISTAELMVELIKRDYGIDEVSLDQLFLTQVEDIQKLIDLELNMVLGTDAGNTFNFHGYSLHEEMHLLELGGIEPVEIIKMGTLNAARMMKVDKDLGSIQVGKIADLVLLEKNPLETIRNSLSIAVVIKNGKVQDRIKL